jgi:hypothetical protein
LHQNVQLSDRRVNLRELYEFLLHRRPMPKDLLLGPRNRPLIIITTTVAMDQKIPKMISTFVYPNDVAQDQQLRMCAFCQCTELSVGHVELVHVPGPIVAAQTLFRLEPCGP